MTSLPLPPRTPTRFRLPGCPGRGSTVPASPCTVGIYPGGIWGFPENKRSTESSALRSGVHRCPWRHVEPPPSPATAAPGSTLPQPEPRHGAATRGQCGNTDARPPARGGPSPQRAAPPSPPAARPPCSGEETRAGGSGRSRITPPGCVRLGKSLPVSQPQAPYLQGCGEVPRASGNRKLITRWSLFLV